MTRDFIPVRFGRPGNALVLVSAMLVLLTLMAAAFLSRAREQRVTASAYQETVGEGRRAEMIAKSIATEVAQHLFVKPIRPGDTLILGGDSAAPRMPPPSEAVRYGVESAPARRGVVSPGDRISNAIGPEIVDDRDPGDMQRILDDPDGFPDGFNYAPYVVSPWTNWPDFVLPVEQTVDTSLSTNAAEAGKRWWNSASKTAARVGDIYGNPIGNPGFGDTRWLRSTEPVRSTRLSATKTAANPSGAFFSHWAHLSWLPTPNNGYRLVRDIGDIEGQSLQGSMSDDSDGFGTPYEQWLADVVPTTFTVAATNPTDPDVAWVNQFMTRRQQWFGRDAYRVTMLDSDHSPPTPTNTMMPNLFRLDDPLGIGRANNPDADPVPASDEFVDGSPRNAVSRTFCDTDGDGFTDSFWFVAPTGKERNIRTVIGVSVVDNAGMVDINTATRFDRRTTVGFTPADIALVSSEPERSDLDEYSTIGAPLTDTRTGMFDSQGVLVANIDLNSADPLVSTSGYPASLQSEITKEMHMNREFDPYRYAGRPNPNELLGSGYLVNDEGEPSLLQSLGIRMQDRSSAATDNTFWNPYFYSQPGKGLSAEWWIGRQSPVYAAPPTTSGLQVDVFGPGGPARPQQIEPIVGFDQGATVEWRPWFANLIASGTSPSPISSVTSLGNVTNQPLMRPEERARWFKTAMTGEVRMFAPFEVGMPGSNQWVVANEINPRQTPRDISGERIPVNLFDASDEMELRAYAGNNDSTNMSRLERSLNGDHLRRPQSEIQQDTILRSSVLRSEGGGGIALTNAQLLKDLRRMVTAVSGTRNELMPPWLWVGRPYLVAGPNARDSYQSATLWLGLHPDTPGPRDENNDGRIENQELQWGVFDLWRVATSNDPYPDGTITSFSSTAPVMDNRDWKRGISLFERLNRKLDLRRPLVLPYTKGVGFSVHTDHLDENGFLRLKYAYSPLEQQAAMLDFVLESRQRLRPALRTHSPQRNQIDWGSIDITDATGQPTIEMLGPTRAGTDQGTSPVQYGSYTDRFVDQLRAGLESKVVGSHLPMVTIASDQASLVSHAGTSGGPGELADHAGWRSAWSCEALTASLAANLATWRSRPDQVLEFDTTPTAVSLRPVWQPILPTAVSLGGLTFKHDPITSRVNATNDRHHIFSITAVDPSLKTDLLPNADFPTGPNGNNGDDPNESTATLAFPGIEKHPFLTECFFAWVYPATTTETLPGSGILAPAVMKKFSSDAMNTPVADPVALELEKAKYVAVVNDASGTLPNQIRNLKDIRTPVLVVQVANPWNEPLRLGDFSLEIFGQWYDFPDFEIETDPTDALGAVRMDSSTPPRPVPLMLNPGTETAPTTATVYLIASSLGNPTNTAELDSPFQVGNPVATQSDLTGIAMDEPWFRRRWLDYLDLYELLDLPQVRTPTSFGTSALRDDQKPLETSSGAWCTYGGNTVASGELEPTKLLNAMAPEVGKRRLTDLSSFRETLIPEGMRRGIVLHRMLRDPGATQKSEQMLNQLVTRGTPPREPTMEVDRFDAHPDFDHFSCSTLTTDSVKNFDTSLVTGGRFWSACARITFPPLANAAELLSDGASFDEPPGDERSFPSPTDLTLLTPLPSPMPATPDWGLDVTKVTEPTSFPGIVLRQLTLVPPATAAPPESERDYFCTWTRVARSWSRAYEARMMASAEPAPVISHPATGAMAGNLPVWTWRRQVIENSFQSDDGTGELPAQGMSPRFIFASRTEPDELVNATMRTWTDAELLTSMPRLPQYNKLTGYDPTPSTGTPGVSTNHQGIGDMFRREDDPNPSDPDRWTPSIAIGSSSVDEATTDWLTSPVWAPLPDFRGLTLLGSNGANLMPDTDWPDLVLRKPTAFNCLTVLDPLPGRWVESLPGGGLFAAYYGDPTQLAAPSLPPPGASGAANTIFALPMWAQMRLPEGSPKRGKEIDPSFEAFSLPGVSGKKARMYLADKGARLVDHAGMLLPIDQKTGRAIEGSTSTEVFQWFVQGAWNSLDRIPQRDTVQMLQKDDDFEQLGELMDVFLWGPAYSISSATGGATPSFEIGFAQPVMSGPPMQYAPQMRAGFAEIMTGRVPGFPVGEGSMINRLQVDPPNIAFDAQGEAWQWGGTSALRTPYAPSIPWGARVFDAFTLDGSGAALRYDWSDREAGTADKVFGDMASANGSPAGTTSKDIRIDSTAKRPIGSLIPVDAYRYPSLDPNQPSRPSNASTVPNGDPLVTRTTLAQWEFDRSPSLSGGLTGKPVRGLINLNTAPIEVLRALPQMAQMVYDDNGRVKSKGGYSLSTPFTGESPVTYQGRMLSMPPPIDGDKPARNPTNLLANSIEVYRSQLRPSEHLGDADQFDRLAWAPDFANPLSPATDTARPTQNIDREPTQPTYADRGSPTQFGAIGKGFEWSSNSSEFVEPEELDHDRSLLAGDPDDMAVLFNRGMRAHRGFDSIGEVALMARDTRVKVNDLPGSPTDFPDWQYDKGWSVRLAGQDPYRNGKDPLPGDDYFGYAQGWNGTKRPPPSVSPEAVPEPLDARLSTDRQGVRTFEYTNGSSIDDCWAIRPDTAFGDSEEQNLIFKGISNLVTTRSDVFTVYFRVRTVKQNPQTGGWNGVDPDSIMEDARYVMCVDRTNVNRPTDEPRIVYFTRVND